MSIIEDSYAYGVYLYDFLSRFVGEGTLHKATLAMIDTCVVLTHCWLSRTSCWWLLLCKISILKFNITSVDDIINRKYHFSLFFCQDLEDSTY